MRSLIPWKHREESLWQPFRELEEWHRSIDDLFGHFMGKMPFEGTAFAGGPPLESLLKNGNLVVRVDLPGVDPKEIDISVAGDQLTVKGERKHKEEAKEGEYTRREIAYGSFERSMTLPKGVDADKIKASFDKGVLEITMPAPKELAPKKVSVQIEAKK
ncbi:MAG: Hsp20/alpha crystallin family protein [Deltaproteobacteria bacterium]|nr:Hsp20/alpha crystallin family protein [Deltaproteobacteria bacterium]